MTITITTIFFLGFKFGENFSSDISIKLTVIFAPVTKCPEDFKRSLISIDIDIKCVT